MTGTNPYAISTIALSVYNLLTANGLEMKSAELLSELEVRQLPGITSPMMRKAVAELKKRGWILSSKGKHRSIDAKRRIIQYRDRTDAELNPLTGETTGGWNGWAARHPHLGFISIEQIVRESKTGAKK